MDATAVTATSTSSPTGTAYVVGVVTRTDNVAEADPETARIPALWTRALADPRLSELAGAAGRGLVAVLTDYESDERGAYTQLVGVPVDTPTGLPAGLVAVAVPHQARELVPARGAMPGALVAAWREIWRRTGDGTLRRTFGTDVEIATADGADVYLSVEPDGQHIEGETPSPRVAESGEAG